jgi:membrane fusion protein, multidrug efflux system
MTATQRQRFAAGALLLIAAAGCKRDNADAANATPTGMVVGPENIAVVKAQTITSGPALSGTLMPVEQANVRAEVGGSVLQTLVEQGQRVARGQTLARIDDSAIRDQALSAQSAVTTAQSTVDIDRKDLTRDQTLNKAGAIADRDVERAQNTLSGAEAQLANAKAMLANARKQLDKTNIVSPFAGVVSARQVSAGDVVQPGGALYTVVNPSTMQLEASVPADALSDVHIGDAVAFSVNGYPDRQFVGHVTRINPVADPSTRQVRLVVALPNEGGQLVGGLFADGHVASETRSAPVVPLAAVDERELRPFVMRLKSGQVQKSEVTLGIRDAANETVEIRSGVQPGDTILMGAARGISPGTPLRVTAPSDTPKHP